MRDIIVRHNSASDNSASDNSATSRYESRILGMRSVVQLRIFMTKRPQRGKNKLEIGKTSTHLWLEAKTGSTNVSCYDLILRFCLIILFYLFIFFFHFVVAMRYLCTVSFGKNLNLTQSLMSCCCVVVVLFYFITIATNYYLLFNYYYAFNYYYLQLS